MKVYLDTTVIQVLLFGEHTERDRKRRPETLALFEAIDQRKLDAVVSFYALQEIYAFCQNAFPATLSGRIARRALAAICEREVELVGLLSRQQRLLHRRTFDLPDASDEPHVILAYITGCEFIVTYDEHFDAVREKIGVCTPAQILQGLSSETPSSQDPDPPKLPK